MKRIVTLGSGQRIGLGAYVKAWRAALDAPADTTFKMSPRGMPHAGRDEVLRDFRDGMHDRINRHIPGYGQGRRWAAEWQSNVRHVANAVNTPRVVLHWLPAEYYDRLAHRLSEWAAERDALARMNSRRRLAALPRLVSDRSGWLWVA